MKSVESRNGRAKSIVAFVVVAVVVVVVIIGSMQIVNSLSLTAFDKRLVYLPLRGDNLFFLSDSIQTYISLNLAQGI